VQYNIGDYVRDEDGNTGIVCIRYNDGDLCTIENDAAHPNPKLIVIEQVVEQNTGKSFGGE